MAMMVITFVMVIIKVLMMKMQGGHGSGIFMIVVIM